MFKHHARKRTLGMLLGVGALAVASLLSPATAQPAQAAVSCPTGAVAGTPVDGFETIYNGHGVAMCHALDGSYVMAQVQIIDLAAGATLDLSDGGFYEDPDPAYNSFRRLSIQDFAQNANVGGYPAISFSVTNASFFASTSSEYTELSLPYKWLDGVAYSYGTAISGTDPNSPTAKRVLGMNWDGSQVRINTFPAFYSESDATCSGFATCVVGFDPLVDVSGDTTARNNRTFVGLNSCFGANASQAFILTGGAMTVGEANAVLNHFGACANIQLDGGGSTQMNSYAGDRLSLIDRYIPTVLVAKYAR